MDEGSGTTIGDKAGTNTGTISGADVDDVREVRVGALVRRDEQHRQHPGREQPRPHDRHDRSRPGCGRRASAPHGAPRSSRRQAPTTRTASMRTPARPDRARMPSRAAPTTISAAAPPSSPNTWAHVATTYDGAKLRLYVDGALVGSQAATGSIATSTGALQDRRQRDLGRVLRRSDRRGAHLQPGADAGRDPDGHDPEHRHARHDRTGGAGDAVGQRARSAQSRSAGPRRATTSA